MGARVFFALVGVGCIALGAHVISTNRYLVQHGVRTTGVVVAYHRYDSKGSPTYSPQVRYVGPGRHTYVVEGMNRSTPQFRLGESVTVYYDPRDPETALVYGADTDVSGWVCIIMGCVLGVLVPLRLAASPAARRRRMLKLLHRLGGASLVWDAYEGGHFSLTYRSSDGEWHSLVIAGLHLQDTAGNRVPLRAITPWGMAPRSTRDWIYARDCAHEAKKIAQHYSTEPGHYVLALPKGTVISAPSHRPAARPEPTPPQAPLPVPPKAVHTHMAPAEISVRAFVSGLIGLLLIAALFWALSGGMQ